MHTKEIRNGYKISQYTTQNFITKSNPAYTQYTRALASAEKEEIARNFGKKHEPEKHVRH